MADARTIFAHGMEAMFLRAWPAESESLRRAYAQAGLDLSRPLLPGYSDTVWRACLRAQAAELLPELSPDEARRVQGVRFIESYFETPVGKAMLLVLRAIGPKRTLERMRRNFRSANNFVDVTSEQLGEASFRLTFNDVMADGPEWVCGVLARGLGFIGVAGRTNVVARQGDGAIVSVEW